MHSVLLLGAGKIGAAIARLLSASGDYDVLVGDANPASLERLSTGPGASAISTVTVDVSKQDALPQIMRGRKAVISACSFDVNSGIAQSALESGLSYFDLTEDVATTRSIKSIAQRAEAGQAFIPQCGLAPGFVSIAAHHLTKDFSSLDEVRMRVGALPKFPTNEMKYNLTWSTDGLINEYGNPCEAVHRGQLIEVLPLEGLEHFSLDGIDYEAFNTSGGVGTLAETLAGKVRELNYKTIRYRGHRDLMAFLMNELRLNDRRAVLKDILEHAVPVTPQDVVLIFCTVSGTSKGRFVQLTDARKIYHGSCLGEEWSAIQMTTASSLCAVLDLYFSRQIPTQGFVKQEQIGFNDFLTNRFGKCYARDQYDVSAIV